MKILLTIDEMHEIRGGTQVFIFDLVRHLQRAGHEVAVHAWLRGELAEELLKTGVPVVSSPRECPFVPDVIHAQHHLSAMSTIMAFPEVPAMYHCHGYAPWQERPPVHPRILRYGTMASVMVPWITTVTGCRTELIAVIPVAVPLDRFSKVGRPSPAPRRAALFGNPVIATELREALDSACIGRGISLDAIGQPYGTTTAAPENLLPDYDLCFAIGRSALEGLACGNAVILFGPQGCGPMIRPDNLEPYLNRNLTVVGAAGTGAEARRAIEAALDQYNPELSAAVTADIRERRSFDKTCATLESLYIKIVEEWQTSPRATRDEEFFAVEAYLASLGPYLREVDDRFTALRLKAEKHRRRAVLLKSRLTEVQERLGKLQAQWSRLQGRLPGVIRRWLLRDS